MVNVESPEREFRAFRFFIWYSCVVLVAVLFSGIAFFHIMKDVLNIFVVLKLFD